eukprot:795927-Pyramimonas_sp.AAC.1
MAALHREVRLLDGNKVGPTDLHTAQQGLKGRIGVGVHRDTNPGTPLPWTTKGPFSSAWPLHGGSRAPPGAACARRHWRPPPAAHQDRPHQDGR